MLFDQSQGLIPSLPVRHTTFSCFSSVISSVLDPNSDSTSSSLHAGSGEVSVPFFFPQEVDLGIERVAVLRRASAVVIELGRELGRADRLRAAPQD
jgi:hypothetical protein